MKIYSSATNVRASVAYVLCFSIMLFASSYEGTIGKYPVWIAFDSHLPDGNIKGTYFYSSTGLDIQLEGIKAGNVFSFTEYDKSGKATGKLQCAIAGNELSGTWINSSGKKKLEIKARETNPERMKDAQCEAQLDSHDQKMLNTEFPAEECTNPALSYNYKSKYIRSVQLVAEYTCGPYPSSQSRRKVYNALTGKDINFWEEIEPGKVAEAKAYLQSETQKKFKECRAAYPDSEWVEAFKGYPEKSGVSEEDLDENPKASLDKIFTVKNADQIMTEFYIDSEGANLGRCLLFEFAHVMQAMDFCAYVVFTKKELKKYLKSNSILLNIAK
jgi:hypothetical protein